MPGPGSSLSSVAAAVPVDNSPPPLDQAAEFEEELYTPEMMGC